MPSPVFDRQGSTVAVASFAFSIFLSAFLIFQVQPMVGKNILPWFGGVPAVWNMCLAFYQITLFLGYAYAHLLVRRVPANRQALVHGLFFLLALAALPVIPDESWKPTDIADPVSRILAMLTANVGLPFFILAATGPLLQVWFVRACPGRSPYPLYAVSNAGSVLALLSYPVLIEPLLPLSSQATIWSWGFAVCAAVVMGCAALAARSGDTAVVSSSGVEADSSRGAPFSFLWVLLPASAVMLFMGVTNEICLNIASVPFLWIIPLTIYLLTFILCFGSVRIYHRGLFSALALIALLVILNSRNWAITPSPDVTAVVRIGPLIGFYAMMLFAMCMLAHGELFRLRPAAAHLTSYYLYISGGGALGGLFVSIAAPRLFTDYYELSIGVLVCLISVAAACWRDPSSRLHGGKPRWAWVAVGVIGVAASSGLAAREFSAHGELVLQERNFFGVLRVAEKDPDNPKTHRFTFQSGTTLHGAQRTNPAVRMVPTLYFGRVTGVGLVMHQRAPNEQTNVGIIGLGVGTLAGYAREGDRFKFYEIDEDVVQIARDTRYFSYLSEAAVESEIVIGDGRLSLETELREGKAQAFDILVIDAFSSDAIPVHLLTKEAFEIYRQHLAPDGVILMQASNWHLDLAPIVFGLAHQQGMVALRITNREQPRYRSLRSMWVLVGRDSSVLDDFLAFLQTQLTELGVNPAIWSIQRSDRRDPEEFAYWTDDYSDVIRALRFGPMRRN